MPSYQFPADAGQDLPGQDLPSQDAGPQAIAAVFDKFGLPHGGVRIGRQGGTVTLEGQVADAGAAEMLVLAAGNLQGVSRVEDRLASGPAPGLLDSLGGFARLPAGAASTEAAGTALRHAEPEAGTRFGPAGSLFHTLQPGETLADVAARHYGGAGADAERRLRDANAALLPDAVAPGLVLRVPPK